MKRLFIYSGLTFFLLIGTWLIHVWISTPLQIPRWIYPLEAWVVSRTTQCSPATPTWLRDSAAALPIDSRSSLNQLAYLDKDGHIHDCRNGWMRGVLQGERVTEQTSFRIASLTKFFTAFLAVEAHQDGRLSVDAPVMEALSISNSADSGKHADEAWQTMRVADLLRHSAGFDRLRQPDLMVIDNKKPPCPGDLSAVRRYALDFSPGIRYSYGNLNYCLLGVALEKVYEQSYRTLVSQHFQTFGTGRFVDGPYAEDEPFYDVRFRNYLTKDYWRLFDFQALSSSMGFQTSAKGLMKMVGAQYPRLGKYLAFANTYVLPGTDCSKFMQCYSLMGSYFEAEGRHANVWRGNLVGTAAMLIVKEDGTALVWLGGGGSPQQYKDDERMFSFWLRHM